MPKPLEFWFEFMSTYSFPTFVVAGELFWGNDRLDLALDQARK